MLEMMRSLYKMTSYLSLRLDKWGANWLSLEIIKAKRGQCNQNSKMKILIWIMKEVMKEPEVEKRVTYLRTFNYLKIY